MAHHVSPPALAVLLALLPLGACHTVGAPPDVDRHVQVPASWSAAPTDPPSSGDITSTWWKHFDDPLLDDLVARALAANSDLMLSRAGLDEARALRDLATAALWPSVGIAASAQRGRSGGQATGNRFAATASGSWNVDLFGANRQGLAAAQESVRSGEMSVGYAQITVAAETVLTYITLRAAQFRLQIATVNLASQQESLQITQWRQQAGLATVLDTEQARAATEQTHALLPALRFGNTQARHALAVLVGEAPAALDSALDPAQPIPHAQLEPDAGIPAATLRQRPDVRAAEHDVSAALARVRQARAARAPSFSLSGTLGLAAASVGSLTDTAAVVSSILGAADLALLDGGAGRARVHAQRAALEQSRLRYRATTLGALQQVEDALAALSDDRERRESLRTAADSAATAAQLATDRYGSGLVDFQVVLQTQRTQLATQDGLASADADVSADQVRLFTALGGGWQEGLGITPPLAAARVPMQGQP